MRISALLPMKGNSERVPNKNIKAFGGGLLFHAVADSLLSSKYIDQLVINTDSEEISCEAKSKYGEKVKIIERPKSIQGDYVSMNEIIKHDIDVLGEEHFLQTHSTNPMLKTKTIDLAVEKYFDAIKNGFDSLFSVTKLQTRLYDVNGKPVNHNPNELRRTQDLDPLFEENSNFFIFSKTSFYNLVVRQT